ncbi:Unconventional myosin-XVIIIa [Melipona quadrifasciata]|uniref:Unconventional myosin-XVIIIa n=1 Tax=Melipona quadrifasciata TaxID=166423 RepID=A0A0M9A8L5_9HYME|nr:Unconventional myosin-XVIIIa [Melipona quadrifasciata]
MPSVPTTYSGAISPDVDNSQSFEESLNGKMLAGRAIDSNSTIIESSRRLLEPMMSAKRPPLPPFRRPASKLHTLGLTRSPSPCSFSSSLSCRSARSMSVVSSRPRTSIDSPTFSTPPRRMFPLANAAPLDPMEDLSVKEQAPVVFDASLNFVLGCDKQRVKQSFRPTASHMEPSTASSYLSSKISQFLKRTDHIMDEWRSMGHRDDADNDLNLASMARGHERCGMGRSQSATNIMIRGYQYYSRSSSIGRNSRRSLSRTSDDRTLSDGVGQVLSEMTADFAEEHSTSTLAAERIDAETSERLRLERELQDVTEANKNLQQTTERLEMELLYARAADLNGVASDAEDGEDGGVYKQRYEHAIRELEFTKRKMAQQHEDDLEQLVGLKKQLEKKLADAYEEVEEQRQVVGQWKRRVQKLNGEMHDLRLLLEEQTARNNLLEKKQRKFDSETQNLMNDLRQEKAQRERLAREKEIAIAEKFTIEQNLSDARLEIELKEERLRTLSQELEELTFGGKTEEEVAQLKKAKHELEKRRDLKRTKALLRDAQTMLERSKGDSTGKAALRQLKNQLEDAECARAVAVKAKQALEQELNETQASLEEALRQRSEAEDRANVANRERAELLSQLEENEEELAEVLKKYRAAVQQVSAEQGQLQEAQVQIAALEAEKSSLKDQLESKLELEQTTRARLETQIARLKENVDKLQTETALLRTKEQSAQDASRRLQRSLRESREEASSALAREQESTRARRELEKSLEAAEAETKVARDDLRLALQRIDDLQSAIQGELDLDCSEEGTTENSDRYLSIVQFTI